MVRQGVKKSPPNGRAKASSKPRPPGVVPITKFFSKSPKSKSSPPVTKAADSSAHNTTQVSPPLKELPKPALSGSSNQCVNGVSETTASKRVDTRLSKLSSKKIRVGDVRVVLRKSPIKREIKVQNIGSCTAEYQHKAQAETPQNNVIVISDSPAELSSSLSIDVELTAPDPKRLCLIDLTESPITVMDTQQKNTNTLSLNKSVFSENSDKRDVDVEERVKDALPTLSSAEAKSNCTIKKVLFTDYEMQSSTAPESDDEEDGLASTLPPSTTSQKNDKIQDNSSSTIQPLTPTAGEGTIEPIESPTVEGAIQSLTPAAREGAIQPLNSSTVEGVIRPLTPDAGEGATQPLNSSTVEEVIRPLTPDAGEGTIQPLNPCTSAEVDCITAPSLAAADSTAVARGERFPPGYVVLDEHSQALNDLELVLCQRGASYFQGVSCAVKLFSTTQDSVLDNLLDFNSRVQSQKLTSIVQYLRVATTPVTMPKAHALTKVWELITDPITSSSSNNFPVLDDIVHWFHQLLLLHPPGQHHTVDQQYALFFYTLSGSATGALFGLWEHIMDLMSGSEYCIQFLSILVDLLLADYWAFLDSRRKTPPLFVRIFWQNSEQTHLTVSIRKLLEVTTLLLLDYSGSKIESLKLCNLMLLLYLASTRCCNLTTELLLIAQKLPVDKVLLFFSHIQPLSLSNHLAENVPQLKEVFARFANHIKPSNSGAVCKLFKPSSTSNTSLLSPGHTKQAESVDNEEEAMECTPSLRPQTLHPQDSIQDKQHASCPKAPLPTKGASLQVKCINSTNYYHQERKRETPSIMNVKRRQPNVIRGKEHTSVVVAQVVYVCENCRNGTCPRCIQAHSIPVNHY